VKWKACVPEQVNDPLSIIFSEKHHLEFAAAEDFLKNARY